MSPTSLGREHPPPTLTADKFIKFTSDHTIPEGLVSRMPDTLSAVGGGEHLHHRLQKIHCQPQRPTSTPAYGQAQADRQRLCTEPATGLPGCSALGVHLIQAGTPSPPITGDTDMLQQPLQQQTKIFSVTVRSTAQYAAGTGWDPGRPRAGISGWAHAATGHEKSNNKSGFGWRNRSWSPVPTHPYLVL